LTAHPSSLLGQDNLPSDRRRRKGRSASAKATAYDCDVSTQELHDGVVRSIRRTECRETVL
jgi:hypothetical protein